MLLLFMWSEIQYGRPGLWFADTLSTSSQEWLKGSTPNLPQMFPVRSWPSVVTFDVDPKSNMAALASDWLIHYQLLLKNDWRDLLQTCNKCSLWGPNQVWLLFKWSEIQYGRYGLWLADTFNFLPRITEGIYSKLATNSPYEVRSSVVAF